jgi:hypothetical protein
MRRATWFGLAAALAAGAGGALVQASAARQGAVAPTATTGAATNVTLHLATLHGTVNPGGDETTYRFRYGLTKRYGRLTPAESAGAGASPVQVSAQLDGLRFGRTYHYRLIADNSSGHAAGADRTFRTHEPRIKGRYRTRLRIIAGGKAFEQHRGARVGRWYHFRPSRCTPVLCKRVRLSREGKRGRFRAMLHRTGPAAFSGRSRFRGWCDDGLRFRSASRIFVRARKAPSLRASSINGFLRLHARGCVRGSERATLRGSAR